MSLNFLLALCECESVRVCAGGRGMACIGVIISGTMGKQHENLQAPQGHLALNTSCEGCLCLRLCVCAHGCVCVCLPVTVGCDFYIAIRRDSTDH